ncbi:MAG TPA: hypothetical protein VF648_20300 [Pyrinomonadaceae bacterium]
MEIRGITESSTKDNMEFKATYTKPNNQIVTLDTENFTVISVTLSLRTSGTVSSDNAGRTAYNSAYNTTSLGLIQHSSLPGWFTGVEIVGTVAPNDFSDLIVLKREVLGARKFDDMTLVETTPQGDDTSFPQFRDDNPQSGGSNGKVYDLDGPGIGNNSNNPIGTIGRLRANFRGYATVDGNQVSGDLFWFTRVSVRKISNGDAIHNQFSADNQAGTGATNLTWNLQP